MLVEITAPHSGMEQNIPAQNFLDFGDMSKLFQMMHQVKVFMIAASLNMPVIFCCACTFEHLLSSCSLHILSNFIWPFQFQNRIWAAWTTTECQTGISGRLGATIRILFNLYLVLCLHQNRRRWLGLKPTQQCLLASNVSI